MDYSTVATSTRKNHSIRIGLLVVFGVIMLGGSVAFATGAASPLVAKAIDVLPPCCTVPTPPVLPPVLPPVVVIPPDVLPPCCTEPPVVAPPVVPPVVIPPVIPPIVPPVTPPISPVPQCTLSANPSAVQIGGASVLTWTTTNATTFTIDHGVNAVTPVAGGTRSVTPLINTTYTGTATGPGGTVNCAATVTVTLLPAPACTLSASPTSIAPGGTSTLTWTTVNGNTFSLDNAIGVVTPTSGGTRSVSPSTTTTYTGTVTGTGGATAHCAATVTVSTTPPAPACTLSASASSVVRGGTVDLTWTTANASSASIDNSVGVVTPTAGGTKRVTVDANTTYVLTATGTNGGTVTCSAPVTVTTGGGSSPMCTLTASPTNITTGSSFALTWGGTNITDIFIDNGVGTTTTTSGSQNITPPSAGNYTYTGTYTTTTGSHLNCTASVSVTNGGGGCTSNCGGGGGGSNKPRVLLTALKNPGEQPLAFVYLSQIPYTGLDLGTWGTAMYWLMLILWSLAAAYLVLFTAVPFTFKKVNAFGGNVKLALASTPSVSRAPAESVHEHIQVSMHEEPSEEVHAQVHAAPEHTQAPVNEGFRAYAQGSALTIDDIVNGLAREAKASPTATAHDLRPDFMIRKDNAATTAASFDAPVPQPEEVKYESAPRTAPEHAPVSGDVSDFLSALLHGDRDTVFATIRNITRTGGNSEEFLTHAVCALDDAYRAQVDGSVCHPDIAKLTSECHPSFLEKVVTALTTAVDGSYSTGVTGVKLALTRAIAVVNG